MRDPFTDRRLDFTAGLHATSAISDRRAVAIKREAIRGHGLPDAPKKPQCHERLGSRFQVAAPHRSSQYIRPWNKPPAAGCGNQGDNGHGGSPLVHRGRRLATASEKPSTPIPARARPPGSGSEMVIRESGPVPMPNVYRSTTSLSL